MKIGIYGGSFNPIHKGHIAIAKIAINKLNLDKLIFVPAFKSPFKSKVEYASSEDRIKMIQLVKPEKSEISLFEIERKGVSYTIDSIRYFKELYPNDELFFIIGSDNVQKLNMWKEIDEIVSLAKIVVFRRETNFDMTNIEKYNCLLLDNEILDYASSWFRKGYMQNLDEIVLKYISQNHLYIPEIMSNVLDVKTYKHSMSTARWAAQIAKSIGLDPKKAWVAGSLHDITKAWPKKSHRDYLDKNNISHSQIDDFNLHSHSAYYWLKNEYKLDDKEILNAVLRHLSLDDELSTLDKIIFVADKISEGRTFDGIEIIREQSVVNFEQSFKNLLKIYYTKLEHKNKLTEREKEIFNKWM